MKPDVTLPRTNTLRGSRGRSPVPDGKLLLRHHLTFYAYWLAANHHREAVLLHNVHGVR